MTLIELKKSIHEKIDHLNDPDFLELVNTMINNYHLDDPEALEKSILTGYEQSQKGLTKPHSKVMQGFIDKYK